MLPKFQIIDVTINDNNKTTMKITIIDDEKYLGFIFTFKDIDIVVEEDGAKVSYDLVVDIDQKYLPNALSNEENKAIEQLAHNIIKKIIEDLVNEAQNVAYSLEHQQNVIPLDTPA